MLYGVTTSTVSSGRGSLPVVHGKDVFVRLATGSGKSCMFLAPLAISDIAMAVIISPLNGLMDEQVCAIYFGRMCTNWLLGITD